MKKFMVAVVLLITVVVNMTVFATEPEVSGIKISVSKTVMQIGETQRVIVSTTPTNADVELEYISSNPDVVTAAVGTLIAKKNGIANITIKVKNTEIQDGVQITVSDKTIDVSSGNDKTENDEQSNGEIKVLRITAENKTLYLERYETERLIYTVSPSNATNKNVSFRSSNTSVATVDFRGYVEAEREGTAIITIESDDGNAQTTVRIYVSDEDDDEYDSTLRSIYITQDDEIVKDKIEVMEKTSVKLGIKTSPSSASKKVKWRSSDTRIATVDNNGKVTGVKKGTCTIYATSTSSSSKRDSVKVVVSDYIRYPDSIKITPQGNMASQTGNSVQFTAALSPEDTTERNVIWTVYGGATITQTGYLQITDSGEITVKAYSSNHKVVGEYKFNAEYSVNHFSLIGRAYNLMHNRSIEMCFDNEVNIASAINGIFASCNETGNGERINIEVKAEGEKVTVKPADGWPVGDVYLFVKGTVSDTQGNRLGKNLKYKLNIRGNSYDK